MPELLRFLEVLFIIDDIIANEILDKRRQTRLELFKTIFVWYSNVREDLKGLHYENNVLTDDELVVVRGLLRKSKHACLYIQNEYPRGFSLLNHAWGVYFEVSQMDTVNAAIISSKI